MLSLSAKQFPWDNLADKLSEPGLFIEKNFLSPAAIPTFDQWFEELKSQHLFKPAKIGKMQEATLNPTVRSDLIYWVDSFPANFESISGFLDTFIQNINPALFVSLRRYEMHLSCYQKGSFYKTHIDKSSTNQNRILTLILYLNPHWKNTDGGELVIYSPENESKELIRVSPEFGTLVIFRSDLFPHEVLPANTERRALTGWFRND